MNVLRSIVFNIFFFAGSFFWCVVLLPTLLLPQEKCTKIVSTIYGGYITLIEKYILWLKLEIKGFENIPKTGAYIIAAKHQSAYETLKLPYMKSLGYPAIILKKELTYIPIYGWYFWGRSRLTVAPPKSRSTPSSKAARKTSAPDAP